MMAQNDLVVGGYRCRQDKVDACIRALDCGKPSEHNPGAPQAGGLASQAPVNRR